MKKDEAIKYITKKGFTNRVAGKIYMNALANTDVQEADICNTITDFMQGNMNTNENEQED